MDDWDPMIVDGFASGRPVILFNNAGVASSSGETPDTIEAMSEHVTIFLRALGLSRVDVLGFSIGGCVAQIFALRRPTFGIATAHFGKHMPGGLEATQRSGSDVARHRQVFAGGCSPWCSSRHRRSSQAAGRAFWGPPASSAPRCRSADVVADDGGPDGRARGVATSAGSAIPRPRDDDTAHPGRKWQPRRFGSRDQCLHSFPTHSQCAVDNISGFRSRCTFSISNFVSIPRPAFLDA